jgi:predicted MFS family arabinose efflux permease
MDRIGALAAVRWALVATSLGMVSLVWTREYFWAALSSRLVWGMGIGLFLPCSMVYLQSRLNQVRFVYLVTLFSAMVPLAQAIAPTIGEFTLDHFGPQVMFVEGAIPALLALVLTFKMRPLERPTLSGRLDFRSSLHTRYALPVLGLLAGGTIFGYAIAYIGPALGERNISLSWFFVASTVAMIGGRVGASRRLTMLPPPLIAGVGLLFSCASLVLAAFAGDRFVAALAGAALGMGNSVMFPVLSSWMSHGLAPTQRAGVQSIAATAFYFGVYATPFPQSWMIGAMGYGNTQLVIAAAGTIVGAVMIAAGRPRSD